MSAALMLFSALLFAIGRTTHRQRARVLSTPVVPAGQAMSGPVSLHGRARGERPERAPITGRVSAYWEAELWDTRWRRNRLPVAKESADVRVIWLDDDSGSLPVLLHGVEWVFAGEDEFTEGQPLLPAADTFVERHGYRWDSGHVRLTERRLEEGGPLYVLGVVAPCGDIVRAVARVQYSPVARAVSAMSHPRTPGERASEPFDLSAYLNARFKPEERLVWCDRRALLIGDRAPAQVARRLGWTTHACYAASAVLLMLATGLFLHGCAS